MKISNRVNERLIHYTIRRPYILLISFMIILTVLFYISWNSYSNMYTTIQCSLYVDPDNEENIYFNASVSDQYIDQIVENDYVIWYSEQDGNRYYGTIREIDNKDYANSKIIQVIPNREDVVEELGSDYGNADKQIYLNFLYEKKRVLQRMMENILK